jgi:hypothetical protein
MTPEILIDDNGSLVISVTNADTLEEIISELEERGSDATLSAMFENYACNGSYTFFNAGHANPCVGLTEAPCIAEAMDTDDEGNNIILGEFWYFDNYMIECPVDTLIKYGKVIFDKAN